MFGTESTDNLYFSVSASQLGNGLDEQLARFVAEHKDTKLIIIDTLQKVREVGGDNYSYANDYQIMARLKSFADAHGLCLLLVHHTRKQNADDKFDMISGTSGLLGAADGAFLLQKEKRTGNAATLEVSGRDQQDQKLYLIRNTENLLWDLQKAETELWKEPPEPLLDEIAELVRKDNPYWEGSPTALVTLINVDIQPHVITRKLNVLAGRLYAEHGILFRSERVHEGRKLRLWKDNTENVQISQELFMQLIRFHLVEDESCEKEIKQGLEKKLDKMVMRDLYGKFKTAPTEEERERAKKEYLDRRGVPESFRW